MFAVIKNLELDIFMTIRSEQIASFARLRSFLIKCNSPSQFELFNPVRVRFKNAEFDCDIMALEGKLSRRRTYVF